MYSHKKVVKKRRRTRPKLTVVAFIVAIFICALFVKMFLVLPVVQAKTDIKNVTITDAVSVPWPSYGQSAVGVKGYGVIAASPNQESVPMASVAKVVTALAILEKKPLSKPGQGDQIYVSDSDAQIYDYYQSHQGVVVDIKPGQSLAQYKALQYMLILSANNIADITANWAFGSQEQYLSYAIDMVQREGLKSIHLDDASGLSPKTVASAEDLIRLGELALDNPTIAEIVAQESIDLPDGTNKINTNVFLNYEDNGVIGIKNGLTDEAGGVLLTAAKRVIDSKEITVLAVVMGSQRYFDSQKDAVALIDMTVPALSGAANIAAGTTVGYYDVPWAGTVEVITKDSITLDKWTRALDPSAVSIQPFSGGVKEGEIVGTIRIQDASGVEKTYDLALASTIKEPSIKWRIATIL